MDMTEIKKALDETFGPLRDAQTKTDTEVRAEIAALMERLAKQDVNLIDLGQKLAGLSDVGQRRTGSQTIGEFFAKSEAFKSMQAGGTVGRARVTLGPDELKAVAPIYESIDPNKYPVPSQRDTTLRGAPENDVWVRDLLPNGQTTSNLIEYVQEKAMQNNANYQVPEGALKAQSDISFEAKQAPVVTIAHWILASRQVLDDAPMLQSYINSRMIYGLNSKVDTELIAGDGAAGHLSGLLPNSTPMTAAPAGTWNNADYIRLAMAQIQAAFYRPSIAILNPLDWVFMQLSKNANGEYLFGSPLAPVTPRLWNMNIAESYAMPAGQFVVGDARQSMVWDRQQVTVEVSREDRDNFVKNMVTILVETRLALSVYAVPAFVKGSFPVPVPGEPPVEDGGGATRKSSK
ncbi:HK97 family phage major capsid protein [Paraburkholderia sp. BL8N3]|nr:phage major capsid protein [Paraburkholderia sp. BL8N3]TCK37978.1 HK97 family phage major capsid protein [Paraburkholderia sp. BL8N3]